MASLFSPKTFSIAPFGQLTERSIAEHLKLYEGYVKHANLIQEHIETLSKDSEKFAYELGELQRRFSFEFGGMRNHEYYFSALENGPSPLSPDSPLRKALIEGCGSFDAFLARFKAIALTRGIGWAKLVFDPAAGRLLTVWLDEQHIGQLPDVRTVLALDVWEHSFVADYQPSGKKQYVEDFFAALDWNSIEQHYAAAIS